MPQRSILIIGSKGHKRATCLNWLEPFPNIEEYDSLIVNMQSLSQAHYDKIQQKVAGMQESVSSMIETGREVFCIINSPFNPTPPSGSGKGYVMDANDVPPSSYDWLPAPIYIEDKKSGNSIFLKNPRFEHYIDIIHNWRFEIYFISRFNYTPPSNFLTIQHPIATNKSNKIIAGTLTRASDRKKALNNEKVGLVHLLPPPEDGLIFQGIECIIEIILGGKDKAEIPWRNDIDVLLDHPFKEKLNKKLLEMEAIQREISTINEQIKAYDCYRDLLTETGDALERIVQQTLNDIGIATTATDPGFPADLINKEAAIEITGIKGSVGADSNKITQTGRFIQNYRKNEKVILIVNTNMNTHPKDRKGKINFTREMGAYLKSLSVSYLTTETLFELWKKVITGELSKDQVKALILGNIGEVTS